MGQSIQTNCPSCCKAFKVEVPFSPAAVSPDAKQILDAKAEATTAKDASATACGERDMAFRDRDEAIDARDAAVNNLEQMTLHRDQLETENSELKSTRGVLAGADEGGQGDSPMDGASTEDPAEDEEE